MSCTLTLLLTISTALHNSNRKERLPQKHLSADSSEQAIQEAIADPKCAHTFHLNAARI